MIENFTEFSLENILKFNQIHSLRAYEILKPMYEADGGDRHSFTFDLTEWKETIGIGTLDHGVFNDTVREISKHTEFIVTYKISCLDGTVTFFMYEKEVLGIRYLEQ